MFKYPATAVTSEGSVVSLDLYAMTDAEAEALAKKIIDEKLTVTGNLFSISNTYQTIVIHFYNKSKI